DERFQENLEAAKAYHEEHWPLCAPPSRDHADRLAALDDDAWETLRLGPGWTEAVTRAQEEVRIP
ncbi:hypothetical protein ACFWIZ_44680, partial [Streptomyces sp. NPDC127044]